MKALVHKRRRKAAFRRAECLQTTRVLRVIAQNVQRTHTTQYQKEKTDDPIKNGRRT